LLIIIIFADDADVLRYAFCHFHADAADTRLI